MDNTRKVFREIKADAMLTASPDLRRYLTGFPSSFGFVYTDAQETVFFTDPRYAEGAKAALKDSYISVEVAQSEDSVLDFVKSRKIKKLAVPLERITLPQYQKLRARRFRIVDSMPAFEDNMCFKTDEEIGFIAEACKIAESGYLDFLGSVKEGMTESEAAGLLEYYMRRHGAEDRSFETIAAFGKNTSVPHHAPGNTKLQKGMPVLLDFGCKYGGYCSDITRTFLFGNNDDGEFKTVYEHVLEAHRIAAENIRAGITGEEADAFARDHLKKYGLDKFFTHSLGHGIGINIHEAPKLSARSLEILRNGMVFSIEPGVYFEGKFGIRIEDSVMLENGRVRSFMQTDKKLAVL